MKTFTHLTKPVFMTLLLLFISIAAFAQKQTNTHLHSHSHAQDSQVVSQQSEFHDHMDDSTHAAIQRRLQSNIQFFIEEGILPASANREAAVSLAWPLRLKAGVTDPNYFVVGNFVDHNPAYPNQKRDYNCGDRTYDTNTGYNHKGTDIGIWPFPWHKMDSGHVEVVAAAAGTIISKSDGNYDRNCSMGNSNWNAVYIRHADGSIAWYGHLKNGSVTLKDSGTTVVQGEYLGVVGSSGSSTGPHLHFELYNASGQLVDPYNGPCNTSSSWWANQQPYINSKLHKIMTCFKVPDQPSCPGPERLNESKSFCFGDSINLMIYISDARVGQVVNIEMVRPNGTVFAAWSSQINHNYLFYVEHWYYVLGSGNPTGTWQYRVTYQGNTYSTSFTVNSTTVPALAITASPNAGACSGLAVTFNTRPSNPGADPTYRWQVNGVNAGTGPTYTSSSLLSGNTVRCILTSSSVCASPKTATSNTITMISGVPPIPGTISGLASGLCNSTRQYSVAKLPNATTYTWTVPSGATIISGQGTLMIKVRFSSSFKSGNIGVRAGNVCGTSSTRTLAVLGAPGLPGSISGSASVCKRQLNVGYSVAAVSGATSYTWTVPSGSSIVSGQGTRSIVVNFGTNTGNVSVRASNGCGLSSTRSLAITMPCRLSDDGLGTENPLEANVHPNPSRDQFVLKTNTTEEERYNMMVVDMLGKVIESWESMSENGQLVFGADYKPGMYIVRITRGDQETHVRIIKQ